MRPSNGNAIDKVNHHLDIIGIERNQSPISLSGIFSCKVHMSIN